ncbi:MAG: AAA family ATPase [Chloroflexi bacterium]|nr:AAA family ATPase [Chloroflexota bacterium]
MSQSKREVLAVGGKGGTGKTTLVAIMTKILAASGLKLLVVDADPPVSLAPALGANSVKTVGEIRTKLIEDPEEKRRIGDKPIMDVIIDEALIDLNGISLLVMGRAEGPGCYCSINELLRFGIESLSKRFDITLVDCEAGIEQVNRRVINSVTTLVMVSDATIKGVQTAAYLKEIAQKYGVQEPYRTGLVINKIRRHAQQIAEQIEHKAEEMGLDVLGTMPEDNNIAEYDFVGKPIIDLPNTSPSVMAVRQIVKSLSLT